MTAPKDRPEIQRWAVTGSWENNGLYHCEEDSLGGWVRFSDHLRHLKLAQIAVLENVYSEDHPDEVCENIEYKIAALRKELEG